VRLQLAEGARLEWVPLETIAYPACQGLNAIDVDLAEGAEWLAWDVTALGLPASGQHFDRGCLQQKIHIHGLWLEQARLDGSDQRLLTSATGLAGHRCMGTLVLASGRAWPRAHRERLLEAVRAVLPEALDPLPAGATCLHERVIVLRVLGPVVEPVMALLQSAWAALRAAAWGLPDHPPRIWRV
jgi:urease accessory protein